MKKMKLRSNIKVSAVALSVAALMGGLGMSATANAAIEGANGTTFTTTINVTSDNVCTLTVTPPPDTSFSASWVGNTAANTSTMSNTTADKEPHYIKVTAAGGAACSLNNVKLVTTTPGTYINKRPSVAFGNSGGYWKYGPALTDAKFYTDAAYATAATGVISMVAGNGTATAMGKTVNQAAGTKADSASLGSYITLTSNYGKNPVGHQALVIGADATVSFTSSAPTEVYKSAEFGIGVAVAVDPVNAEGVVDRMLAANKDTVTMPFTVTVTEA